MHKLYSSGNKMEIICGSIVGAQAHFPTESKEAPEIELPRQNRARVGDQHDWTTGGPHDGNGVEMPCRTSHAPLCPCVFLFVLIGLKAKGLLDFQGRRGITSIVRWNIRPVIFGVERDNIFTQRRCDMIWPFCL